MAEDGAEMRLTIGLDFVYEVVVLGVLADRLGHLLGRFLGFETLVANRLVNCQPCERCDDRALFRAALEVFVHPFEKQRFAHQRLQRRAFELAHILALARFERHRLGAEIGQVVFKRRLILKIAFGLAFLGAKQRRLRDVQVAVLDNLDELAIEEGQLQRADMRAVYVRVRHDHDLVVAQLVDVLLACDAHPERGNQHAQLVR